MCLGIHCDPTSKLYRPLSLRVFWIQNCTSSFLTILAAPSPKVNTYIHIRSLLIKSSWKDAPQEFSEPEWEEGDHHPIVSRDQRGDRVPQEGRVYTTSKVRGAAEQDSDSMDYAPGTSALPNMPIYISIDKYIEFHPGICLDHYPAGY